MEDNRDVNQSWTGVVCTLLLSVGLFLAINWLAHMRLEARQINPAERLVRWKWSLAGDAKSVRTVVLGDSSGNQGIDPAVLEEFGAGRTLNLCTVGNMTAVGDVLMLREFIAKHGPPSHVIVVHVYDVWRRHFEPSAAARIPIPFSTLVDSGPSAEESTFLADVFFQRVLPLYGSGAEVRSTSFWKNHVTHEKLSSNGFIAGRRAAPQAVLRDVEAHVARCNENSRDGISEDNLWALGELQSIADQYSIEISIVCSPIARNLFQSSAFQREFHSISGQLADALNSPNVRLYFGKPFVADIGELQSADHVSSEGSRRYTRFIAGQIGIATGRRLGVGGPELLSN